MDEKTALTIRTELTLHGFSQAQIAERVGISKPAFSLMLNGRIPASREIIGRVFYEIHRPIYERAGLLPTAAGQSRELALTG